MTQIQTFQPPNSNLKIQGICINGDPWFRGKDIATVLGYANTTQALIKNVDDDDKKKMGELGNLSERLLDANEKKQYLLTKEVYGL